MARETTEVEKIIVFYTSQLQTLQLAMLEHGITSEKSQRLARESAVIVEQQREYFERLQKAMDAHEKKG
jgi:hypothetical protein